MAFDDSNRSAQEQALFEPRPVQPSGWAFTHRPRLPQGGVVCDVPSRERPRRAPSVRIPSDIPRGKVVCCVVAAFSGEPVEVIVCREEVAERCVEPSSFRRAGRARHPTCCRIKNKRCVQFAERALEWVKTQSAEIMEAQLVRFDANVQCHFPMWWVW